jgi:predicted nucleic acid-binding protein
LTLIDTSAWVEFLRATGSTAHAQVRRAIELDRPIHTTDVVVMEVLAGARDDRHAAQLRRLLGRCEFVPVARLADFERGAALYRQCRRAGDTVRALNDCLIAAVAIRAGLDVLHADRDFDVIARHCELELYAAPRGGR